MRKLVIVDAGFQTHRPFESVIPAHACYHGEQSLTKDDILVLEGGVDVNPKLYQQQKGKYTQSPNMARDQLEIQAYQAAVRKGIPIIGICRGAQFLSVMTGGSLVQDVNGHQTNHQILTSDGEILITSSVHHQMMKPKKDTYELLAWSLGRSTFYMDGNDEDITNDMEMRDGVVIEPEVVFFPKVKALAIQGHPEFMSNSAPFNQYCRNLITTKLLTTQGV